MTWAQLKIMGNPLIGFPHHLSSDFHTDEDYALVSRSFDGQTHTMIVLVSGFTQYGTEAAAEVITDPTLLAELFMTPRMDGKGRIYS